MAIDTNLTNIASKISNLTGTINAVTSANDSNLTDAVNSLINQSSTSTKENLITGINDETKTAYGITYTATDDTVQVSGTASSSGSYSYLTFTNAINLEAGKNYVFGIIDENGMLVNISDSTGFYVNLYDGVSYGSYLQLGNGNSIAGGSISQNMSIESFNFWIEAGTTINLTFKLFIYEV